MPENMVQVYFRKCVTHETLENTVSLNNFLHAGDYEIPVLRQITSEIVSFTMLYITVH